VLTHSMSGKPGWLVADARPKLVKGTACGGTERAAVS
jgi:hypothetical protein